MGLVKHVQKVHFGEEFMKNNFSKPLKKLNVFVDHLEIFRIGESLNYLSYSYDISPRYLVNVAFSCY